jgi:hypothetical protein
MRGVGRRRLSSHRQNPANRLFDRCDVVARRRSIQVVADTNDEPVAAHRDAEPHTVALEPIDLGVDIRHAEIRAQRRLPSSRPLRLPTIFGRLTAGRETARPGWRKSLISRFHNRYDPCTFLLRQATPNVRTDSRVEPT